MRLIGKSNFWRCEVGILGTHYATLEVTGVIAFVSFVVEEVFILIGGIGRRVLDG